ncbi:MAG: mechanosensitive ion channel family protein [Rickettsiella sp.]|nr:mechanosensitive ion channel family protein [Rickettsiella sp.]
MKILQSMSVILVKFCVIRACIVLIVTGLLCFILRVFYQKTIQRFKQRASFFSRVLLKALYKPLLILIAVVGVTYALEALCVKWSVASVSSCYFIRRLFFIAALAWFLWNFVSLYRNEYLKRNIATHKVDRTLVHALSQIAKLAIIIITALSLFQLLGLSIAGVLAFGGMGGIVIGFAAKDLLANVFGCLMLLLDRPFVIGEQINVPALKVEGQVKAIAWRVCEILTSEGRPVYIPNALFSSLVVENLSRMQSRRFSCCIRLRYEDLAKVPAILEGIQQILRKNSAIDKTRTITVNLNELAPSSLNIVVNAYTDLVNSADFLILQQALHLEIVECINHHSAKWAFQTNSVYLTTEDLSAIPRK